MTQLRLRRVALGGTFDFIHRGHRQLLAKAFEVSRNIVIGLTTDSLVKKERKKGIKPYAARRRQLESYLNKTYPKRTYTIRPLKKPLGEVADRADINGIVVTEETFQRAVDANFIRLQKRLKPLLVYVIPMEKAEDMERISSTRIRSGEIDPEGRLLTNSRRIWTNGRRARRRRNL